MNTGDLDKKYLVRSSSLDIEIAQTEGSYIISADGKRYIDFMTGWCVGNAGWSNEHIRRAIREYNGPDYIYPGFTYRSWAELAELLATILPGDLEKCYRTTGGSESVDTAMQIAMAYTGRKKFLSVEDSYHGNTIGPLSIGASENKEKTPHLLSSCYKVSKPLNEKALDKIETRLKNKDIAAFIMEPVVCNIGVHIPEKEFMQGLHKLCRKYGTLLVIDEVATGFGRTGKLFAIEHFGVEPDVICLGKAITGGYAGMGATVTTAKIAAKVKDKVSIYSTYGWHPLATEVALTNIRFLLQHKISLFNNIAAASQRFRTRLSQMNFKSGGELSIIGLAIAVNTGNTKYGEKIVDACKNKGLLITAQENSIVMFPPLTVDEETIEAGLNILEECL